MTLTLDRSRFRQISQWQDQFLQLNQQRLGLARGLLSARHQHLLTLLPSMLHFNHPQLPGFVDFHTPQGIDHFRSDAPVEQAMRYLLKMIPRLDAHQRLQGVIGGLYLMGSMGTLAQNQHSDLDIWVCLNQPLAAKQRQQLQTKCDRIEKWAEEQGVELHLFIMDLDEFRSGQQKAAEGEDCGTSQHLLLLDEFYRSAIWLAGRWPSWWLIPVRLGMQSAEEYWSELLQQDLVQPDRWLDFGHIGSIPVNEFMGAAMWQLNKSLHSPYKSLLKLMLYRSYASTYPNAQPLCQDLKTLVHAGVTIASQCDAYLLMVQRLSSLPGLNQQRLELIRRAFYYKTGLRLSKFSKEELKSNWRASGMMFLAQQWQWSEERLQELDSNRQWTPQQVFRERNELVNELMGSYRQLRQFRDRHAREVHISPGDIQRLGNQMHAAYDARPGKIVPINPGISPDLVQHHVTLVHFPGVWQLVPGFWQEIPPDRHILRQSPSLTELLVFAELNGLLGRDTRISSFPAEAVSQHELKLTLGNIRELMSREFDSPDWLEQPHITHVRVFINAADDPMAELTRQGIHKITDHDDVLNFTGASVNLVRTIEILTRNQWGEWQVEHCRGQQALNHCLQMLMPWLTHSEQRPDFGLNCYSTTRSAQIRQRLLRLMSNAIDQYQHHHGACIYRLGNRRYGLHPQQTNDLDEPQQWLTADITDDDQLMRYLAQPRGRYSATFSDAHCPMPMPLNDIMAHCQPNRWQLFFQQRGATIDFYLVDEFAALVRYRLQRTELKYWLLPTLRFLLQLQSRWYGNQSDFAGLKLFELVEHQHLHPIYKSVEYDWQVHPRDIPEAANEPPAIELTARYDNDRQPTLYCNYEEFSVWQYGPALYQTVCNRIIELRTQHGQYPCYLSDLEMEDSSNRDLLLHWHRKQEQELHINAELKPS